MRRLPARTGPALGALLCVTLVFVTQCAEPERAPSFLVVSMDTTRADHLGVYGYQRDTTPHLDALAARGLVFDQMISVSENTLISHASMFTGLVPAAHGATHVGDGQSLPPAAVTIAQDFQHAGYQTAGFVAHGDWLNAAFGMDRGFETFSSAYRDADSVLAEAAAWLEARDRDRPFLLFVHLFDVHSDAGPRPYEAPAGFEGRYTSGYKGPWQDWDKQRVQGSAFLNAVSEGHVELQPADLAHMVDQYDEGLAATDAALGAFMDGPAREALDQAFVLVSADHGEELGDHGRMLHGSFYDEVVRIPGILAAPRRRPDSLGPPRVVTEQVRLIDVRPTLLALAELPRPARCQGVSLASWLRGARTNCPSGPAAVYHQVLRMGGFKLLRDRNGSRLYNLELDPGERSDLSGDPAHKQRFQTMVAELNEMRARDTALGEELQSLGESHVPGEEAAATEALRAIGYTR